MDSLQLIFRDLQTSWVEFGQNLFKNLYWSTTFLHHFGGSELTVNLKHVV